MADQPTCGNNDANVLSLGERLIAEADLLAAGRAP